MQGPDRPGAVRRGLAWAVDYTVVLAVAVLLGYLTFHRIGALVTDVPALAGKGAWEVLRSRGDLGDSARGLGASVWGGVVNAVRQAFGGLVLFAFLYRFAALAWAGRTPGHALLGLRVVTGAAGARKRRLALRAAVTTAADTGVLALACLLLLDGAFALSALCWAAAVAAFWLNALPALTRSRRSLADRLSGAWVTATPLLRRRPPTAPDPVRAA